jgi:glucokinase
MFLGIEIGGTKLQLVLGDNRARIKQRVRLHVTPAKGAKGIRSQISAAIPELIDVTTLRGVGVGFGGPVDWRTGKICRSHQIEGWSGFDLAKWLEKLTGAPVVVDNDANVAALGETRYGAGKGYDPVFYVTLGSGVGGGLVIGGSIYHGAIPGEAEIGHVRLDRRGTTVESRCSGWAVDQRVRESIKTNPKGALARIAKKKTGSGSEAELLAVAIQRGDATARRLLDDVCEDLAFGLSHLVHLFHPAVIIFGGGLSNLGEPLLAGAARKLREFIMEAFLPGPKLILAQLAEDAVPVGALALAGKRFSHLHG